MACQQGNTCDTLDDLLVSKPHLPKRTGEEISSLSMEPILAPSAFIYPMFPENKTVEIAAAGLRPQHPSRPTG